jgi:hypothetical protein
MAGKYALYLPLKTYTATIETATDAEFGAFVRALLKYDIDGTEPVFEDRAFSMLFESIRTDIDYCREKYNAIVEKRREAGANGGASKSDKKQAAARENGKRGGASQGNRNATKKEAPHQETEQPKEKKQPKQMFRLNEKTTQAESVFRNQLW